MVPNMARAFNIAGRCNPQEHYMLPPERRLGRVMELIDAKKYFTLTGGWQIATTTLSHERAGAARLYTEMQVRIAELVTDLADVKIGDRPRNGMGVQQVVDELEAAHRRGAGVSQQAGDDRRQDETAGGCRGLLHLQHLARSLVAE